jgi:hypothetical protein
LPEGIKLAKTIFGEYKLVNQKDGYSFKIPKEWQGVEEIEYIPEREEGGYTASSVGILGKDGGSTILSIDRFINFNNTSEELSLIKWAAENFKSFKLIGNFSEERVGNLMCAKTTEEVHLAGMYVYFFQKDNAVYGITNGSEDFIKYIILNGSW